MWFLENQIFNGQGKASFFMTLPSDQFLEAEMELMISMKTFTKVLFHFIQFQFRGLLWHSKCENLS